MPVVDGDLSVVGEGGTLGGGALHGHKAGEGGGVGEMEGGVLAAGPGALAGHDGGGAKAVEGVHSDEVVGGEVRHRIENEGEVVGEPAGVGKLVGGVGVVGVGVPESPASAVGLHVAIGAIGGARTSEGGRGRGNTRGRSW